MNEHEQSSEFFTGHACANSGEEINYCDDVYLLQVVQPFVASDGSIMFIPPLAEDGDYLYEPAFFLLEGWEDTYEELAEKLEDTPPCTDDFSILECCVCESGIRVGETMGLASFGEIHRSDRRAPDSGCADFFETWDDDPTSLCIMCLKHLNTDVVEIWTDVANGEECEEGTAVRCWRYGCSNSPCMREESNT